MGEGSDTFVVRGSPRHEEKIEHVVFALKKRHVLEVIAVERDMEEGPPVGWGQGVEVRFVLRRPRETPKAA